MSGKRVAAITKRLLEQFRRDRRTLALLFVAPIVILGLLGYLMRGSSSAPAVGIANEDQGPLATVVAAALASSSIITTTTIPVSTNADVDEDTRWLGEDAGQRAVGTRCACPFSFISFSFR